MSQLLSTLSRTCRPRCWAVSADLSPNAPSRPPLASLCQHHPYGLNSGLGGVLYHRSSSCAGATHEKQDPSVATADLYLL